MADLYLRALESERKSLWATCRLKGLAKDTPERLRIVELDTAIAAQLARKTVPKAAVGAGDGAGDGAGSEPKP